jgi:deoxyribodipyrimidine photo-lyase
MTNLKYTNSLFIFRRDLRLQDNTALNQALNQSQRVIPCFIFDPQQIQPHPYQSQPGLVFMLQALQSLQQELAQLSGKLALYYAAPETVITRLFTEQKIEAVYFNRDYTSFSRQRDDKLTQLCHKLGIDVYVIPDALLHEPEHRLKSDFSPYKVFTAFYNNARQIPIALPQTLLRGQFLNLETGITPEQFQPTNSQFANVSWRGSRDYALETLNQLHDCKTYETERDFPALNNTSHLSVHLKFGTCSIREAYYSIVEQLGNEHPLLRQLYWRDFFHHLAYHFPFVFERSFLPQFANLSWENNLSFFQVWTEGKTGFPIVDAGMRELNATGLMHNRVRMIVASFLVKDLHIDWRWGERYFAQRLLDYDPCVNNGNWQWAASTGCDAQPYFRIFNPWLQQQKFDPDCVYIYRWLPELKDISQKTLHQWDKKHVLCDYPAPILNHSHESQISKIRFKEVSSIYSLTSTSG